VSIEWVLDLPVARNLGQNLPALGGINLRLCHTAVAAAWSWPFGTLFCLKSQDLIALDLGEWVVCLPGENLFRAGRRQASGCPRCSKLWPAQQWRFSVG
jgi:hypothetical protein